MKAFWFGLFWVLFFWARERKPKIINWYITAAHLELSRVCKFVHFVLGGKWCPFCPWSSLPSSSSSAPSSFRLSGNSLHPSPCTFSRESPKPHGGLSSCAVKRLFSHFSDSNDERESNPTDKEEAHEKAGKTEPSITKENSRFLEQNTKPTSPQQQTHSPCGLIKQCLNMDVFKHKNSGSAPCAWDVGVGKSHCWSVFTETL